MLKPILNVAERSTLNSLIQLAENVVLIGHTRPDGDAMGSTLGLACYLQTLGKHVQVVMPDGYPDFLNWLPNVGNIIFYDNQPTVVQQALDDADLIFCLDFAVSNRIAALESSLVKASAPKVVIDHHPGPTIDAVLTVSHPEMSSTCELVFRVVWQLDGFDAVGFDYATCIYTGMMTDTGAFVYNSSSAEVYFIICQLLTKGIDKDKIYRNVFYTYSANRLRLVGYVLHEKLKIVEPLHASYYFLTKEEMREFKYVKGDSEGLVNMPLQIKGLKLSVSLREDTEKERLIWVSLRSVDDFPCNKMAEMFFNGGGHLNASGGRLNCTLEEAEKIVLKALHYFEKELSC